MSKRVEYVWLTNWSDNGVGKNADKVLAERLDALARGWLRVRVPDWATVTVSPAPSAWGAGLFVQTSPGCVRAVNGVDDAEDSEIGGLCNDAWDYAWKVADESPWKSTQDTEEDEDGQV